VSELRIGLGVDAHAFADGIPLVLAGIQFDEDRGLAGHSDGDVVTHALIDALLGAASLGDIGTLFPSDDDALRGVSSLLLLRNAYGKVRSAGFELVNADCVLIGERPRIADRRAEMCARIADTMGVEVDRIAIRATTTDHLGFTGRREGLMAQAVALLRQPGDAGSELE
jgi:2-C-methyl-D-erythritol 2,4-cyclodiphosphate synthase